MPIPLPSIDFDPAVVWRFLFNSVILEGAQRTLIVAIAAQALGLAVEAAPYGIGVRKESTQLKAAIEGALQKLIANGKYKAILIEWGLEGGAID